MIYARVPYFYQYSSFLKRALNCLFYYPTCQNLFSDNRYQVVVTGVLVSLRAVGKEVVTLGWASCLPFYDLRIKPLIIDGNFARRVLMNWSTRREEQNENFNNSGFEGSAIWIAYMSVLASSTMINEKTCFVTKGLLYRPRQVIYFIILSQSIVVSIACFSWVFRKAKEYNRLIFLCLFIFPTIK